MRSPEYKFGESAGKIWRALNNNGCLNEKQLLKITRLNEKEFYAGLGWLARENKISRVDKDSYKLDDTNLTPEIGGNAGKVYQVMEIWGEADVSILKTLTDVNEKDIYAALGWLARENKI